MVYLSQRLAAQPASRGEAERPHSPVAGSQRERILGASERLIAEKGAAATTIEAIVKEAGVSSVTFYEHFEGKGDCFLAAYEMIDEHVRAEMLAAGDPIEPWPEQVRARLAALLDVLSRDLAIARFYLTEPLAAGGDVAARYRDAMQLLAATIRPPDGPTGVDAEVRDQALMGGIATLIARRLNAGEPQRLPELLPDLTALVLRPY